MFLFKKIKCIVIASVLSLAILISFSSGSSITANAASRTLNIITSRVEKDIPNQYTARNVKKGDVKVTLRLSSPADIATFGIGVELGNGLDFVLESDNEVSCERTLGDMSSNKANQKTIFFTTAQQKGKTLSDILIIYVRKNSNLNATNGTIKISSNVLADANGIDIQVSNMQFITTKSAYYKLGDVNNDGYINTKDSVAILNALESHGLSNSSISVYKVANNLKDWFPYARAAEVADTNADTYISKEDANVITKSYASIMANTYKGNLGKQYYTIVSI